MSNDENKPALNVVKLERNSTEEDNIKFLGHVKNLKQMFVVGQTEDGGLQVVCANPDMSVFEILGMLELAREAVTNGT